MNLGKNILELRKKKNVTQDEIAAELGVTAAAVSKWENGCTLPDILMVCALADYFQVTTDELLGRPVRIKYGVIAASSPELGKKIAVLAKQYGIHSKHIFETFQEALNAAIADSEVEYLLVGFSKSLTTEESDAVPETLCLCQSIGKTDQKILDGAEMFLKHFL